MNNYEQVTQEVRDAFDALCKGRVKAAVEAEREACAKVCDRIVEGKDPDDIHSDSQWAALSLAAAIRARGAKHD